MDRTKMIQDHHLTDDDSTPIPSNEANELQNQNGEFSNRKNKPDCSHPKKDGEKCTCEII